MADNSAVRTPATEGCWMKLWSGKNTAKLIPLMSWEPSVYTRRAVAWHRRFSKKQEQMRVRGCSGLSTQEERTHFQMRGQSQREAVKAKKGKPVPNIKRKAKVSRRDLDRGLGDSDGRQSERPMKRGCRTVVARQNI
ncbi:hypothetical protein Pcinc_023642 [Petrolisthes cinctipes]|uniref:Uncharacterized protein n=1 Tax=Petrolisthes cinctipes TaxID=88211 RepID=A0AAE1FCR4_PETCI|nr:hypothetical protein Pcinc_023642 [Petrolisthes cinctipes]